MPEKLQPFGHEDYTVGWICALPKTELVAAEAMLDEEHPVLPAAQPEDENTYSLGRIGDHNVVIACLPAEQTGKASAATVAKDMLRSFPAIRFGLMVGIGGGAPYYGSQWDREEYSDSEEELNDDIRDIRLGDVAISLHTKDTEAVVQYDFGKSLQEKRFVRSGGKLNKPPRVVLNAIARLQGQHVRKGSTIPELLEEALHKYPLIADSFRYPEAAKDRLFKPGAVHQQGRKSCKPCCGPDDINLVGRIDRATTAPSIHYGTIGSADQVLKDAILRDQWAQKEKIICFEMEAAGLMDSYPCLVIRGICDYADSHKKKAWQPYAAATAASCAKELLLSMPGQDVAGLTPIKQMSNQLRRIEKNTTEVKQAMLSSQEEKQRNKILSSLSTLDYNTRQIDIFARHTEGTGTWFLNTSSFTTWRDSPGQTLYCPGIPGAGKTVLTSVIIDQLRPTLHDNKAALAFIYCAYNDRKRGEDLIRSLLKQIASQITFVPDEVKNLDDLYKSQNKPTPRTNDVIQTLRSIASRFSKVYVVIDALDECQDDDRADLLDALNKLRPLMNILVTSRPVASIKQSLHPDLEQCIEAVNDDIITYIEAQIAGKRLKVSDELLKKPELRSQIVSQLVVSAEGMFLHAEFHIQHLALKHNVRDLNEALENLPKTSNQIYERAMERLQTQDRETVSLAKRTLQCVIGAVQLLHIRQLQHALAVRDGDYDIDDEALTAPTHILSTCAGLLTIDKGSNMIRLVHYTAQEFFKENETKYFPDIQEVLTSICLRYLSLEILDQGRCLIPQEYVSRTKTHVLLEYAATNLGKHAAGGVKGTVLQSAVRLFSNKKKVSSATQAAFSAKGLRLYEDDSLPGSFCGIHYASYLGMADVIGRLLRTSCDEIDLQDSWGRSPLSWAAGRGHKEVVKLLVDSDKVHLDLRDSCGRTSLLYASMNGHEAVVKLLINAGKADLDLPDFNYKRTPLSWAAEDGHDVVVKLLLDTGRVNPDIRDSTGTSPLAYAAGMGHDTVVRLLLDTGKVDVDSKEDYGFTPLLLAAKSGEEAVVKLLLDTGKVDVDAKDRDGYTPLLLAADSCHIEVVRRLLDTGMVNVDSKDDYGSTPLLLATRSGEEAVVKLLLDTGKVDVDAKDRDGYTPLLLAAESGHIEIVRLLLDPDTVDVDPIDDRTALLLASNGGDAASVELLLATGLVDRDPKYVEYPVGCAAMQLAAAGGHEPIVKLLIDFGHVDFDSRDSGDRTPLSRAAEGGHKAVVKLLLETGKVDIDSEDLYGWTPLTWAGENGHDAVVELLLDTDEMDVDTEYLDG